jgi:hypothetical protein
VRTVWEPRKPEKTNVPSTPSLKCSIFHYLPPLYILSLSAFSLEESGFLFHDSQSRETVKYGKDSEPRMTMLARTSSNLPAAALLSPF